MSADPSRYCFTWKDLGDIEHGRPNMGEMVPVAVYRLLQFTMKDVLVAELGAARTGDIFIKSGKLAGMEFCRNLLDCSLPFNAFIAQLQQKLKDLAVGILRIERADLEKMEFSLTMAEDLDCSGLPCTNEVVCQYDEGFLAGIFEAYTGHPFTAREIDCWASGDRVCRFQAKKIEVP